MKLKNPFSNDTKVMFMYCYSCFDCGRSDRGLEIHHVTGRNDNKPTNAIPLCPECHSHAGHSQEEETKYKKLTREFLIRENYL